MQLFIRLFFIFALIGLPAMRCLGEAELAQMPPRSGIYPACPPQNMPQYRFQQPPPSAQQNQKPQFYQVNQPPLVQQKQVGPPLPPQSGPGYLLNYKNITLAELINFISQISGKNFIYNCGDLDFCINMISEQPASVEDIMTSLLQILRTHGLNMVEEGNNVVIYAQNAPVSRLSPVVTDENANQFSTAAVITRVFRIYNILPDRIAKIIAPLLSSNALVEVSMDTRHVIVTDLTSNIDKVADLISSLDVPDAALEMGTYVVRNSYPQSLVNIAYQILRPLAPNGNLNMVVQPSSGTIFIVSTPYLVQRAIAVLQSLDVETPNMLPEAADLPPQDFANTNFYVYKLRYHQGEEIAQAMRDIGANLQRTGLANMDLVSAIQSMQWIVVNNTLVFSGTDAAIEKVKRLLGELDRAPKQVYVEVLIIDTTLAQSLDFGVEWIALANEQGKLAFGVGNILTNGDAFQVGARSALDCPPPNAARPGVGNDITNGGSSCPGGAGTGDVPLVTNFGAGFGIGAIGNIIRHGGTSFLTLGALVNALETEGNATIVLNPRILTEDTKEANIFVGQNIPYQTTTVVQKDTGTVTSNFQYEDIGIQLRVTPYISANNMVTLDIDQSISEAPCLTTGICSSASTSCTPATLTPVTTKTLTQTRVHVPDRAFLVLSGTLRDQITQCWTGIPCLGHLPCIGQLFSTTTEVRSKRNLILFIRPVILDTPQEGIDLTNEEGTQFNWDASPCSMVECGPPKAPECEAIINVHMHPPVP